MFKYFDEMLTIEEMEDKYFDYLDDFCDPTEAMTFEEYCKYHEED